MMSPVAAVAGPAHAKVAPTSAWGQSEPVPGLAALAGSDDTVVNSVSCASAGNCSAGGLYEFGTSCCLSRPFVASEVHGTWRQAIEVPGLSALGPDGKAAVTSVSCPSAGNCTAVGYYTFGFYPGSSIAKTSAFAVSQVKGTWGQAIEVPGLGALNTGADAALASVSCASAGNCSAGGVLPKTGAAVTAGQVRGTWGHVRAIPDLAALLKGGDAESTHSVFTQVSCAAAGQCTAGGYQANPARR